MKKNALENALESLKIAKLELEGQLVGIVQAIKAIEGDNSDDLAKKAIFNPDINIVPSSEKIAEPGFDRNLSYSDKFLFILKRENRFLHFREAAEFLVEIEGGDVNFLIDKLTSGTSWIRKNGVIVKINPTNKNRDTFWGSPKWLDQEGNIIEGHDYDKKYLSNTERTQLLIKI